MTIRNITKITFVIIRTKTMNFIYLIFTILNCALSTAMAMELTEQLTKSSVMESAKPHPLIFQFPKEKEYDDLPQLNFHSWRYRGWKALEAKKILRQNYASTINEPEMSNIYNPDCKKIAEKYSSMSEILLQHEKTFSAAQKESQLAFSSVCTQISSKTSTSELLDLLVLANEKTFFPTYLNMFFHSLDSKKEEFKTEFQKLTTFEKINLFHKFYFPNLDESKSKTLDEICDMCLIQDKNDRDHLVTVQQFKTLTANKGLQGALQEFSNKRIISLPSFTPQEVELVIEITQKNDLNKTLEKWDLPKLINLHNKAAGQELELPTTPLIIQRIKDLDLAKQEPSERDKNLDILAEITDCELTPFVRYHAALSFLNRYPTLITLARRDLPLMIDPYQDINTRCATWKTKIAMGGINHAHTAHYQEEGEYKQGAVNYGSGQYFYDGFAHKYIVLDKHKISVNKIMSSLKFNNGILVAAPARFESSPKSLPDETPHTGKVLYIADPSHNHFIKHNTGDNIDMFEIAPDNSMIVTIHTPENSHEKSKETTVLKIWDISQLDEHDKKYTINNGVIAFEVSENTPSALPLLHTIEINKHHDIYKIQINPLNKKLYIFTSREIIEYDYTNNKEKTISTALAPNEHSDVVGGDGWLPTSCIVFPHNSPVLKMSTSGTWLAFTNYSYLRGLNIAPRKHKQSPLFVYNTNTQNSTTINLDEKSKSSIKFSPDEKFLVQWSSKEVQIWKTEDLNSSKKITLEEKELPYQTKIHNDILTLIYNSKAIVINLNSGQKQEVVLEKPACKESNCYNVFLNKTNGRGLELCLHRPSKASDSFLFLKKNPDKEIFEDVHKPKTISFYDIRQLTNVPIKDLKEHIETIDHKSVSILSWMRLNLKKVSGIGYSYLNFKWLFAKNPAPYKKK